MTLRQHASALNWDWESKMEDREWKTQAVPLAASFHCKSMLLVKGKGSWVLLVAIDGLYTKMLSGIRDELASYPLSYSVRRYKEHLYLALTDPHEGNSTTVYACNQDRYVHQTACYLRLDCCDIRFWKKIVGRSHWCFPHLQQWRLPLAPVWWRDVVESQRVLHTSFSLPIAVSSESFDSRAIYVLAQYGVFLAYTAHSHWKVISLIHSFLCRSQSRCHVSTCCYCVFQALSASLIIRIIPAYLSRQSSLLQRLSQYPHPLSPLTSHHHSWFCHLWFRSQRYRQSLVRLVMLPDIVSLHLSPECFRYKKTSSRLIHPFIPILHASSHLQSPPHHFPCWFHSEPLFTLYRQSYRIYALKYLYFHRGKMGAEKKNAYLFPLKISIYAC